MLVIIIFTTNLLLMNDLIEELSAINIGNYITKKSPEQYIRFWGGLSSQQYEKLVRKLIKQLIKLINDPKCVYHNDIDRAMTHLGIPDKTMMFFMKRNGVYTQGHTKASFLETMDENFATAYKNWIKSLFEYKKVYGCSHYNLYLTKDSNDIIIWLQENSEEWINKKQTNKL